MILLLKVVGSFAPFQIASSIIWPSSAIISNANTFVEVVTTSLTTNCYSCCIPCIGRVFAGIAWLTVVDT